ncbi:MAG: methylated-DNA--[protein]-cysteine S-methyltransferase [Thermotogota bacterium]|nr:methylated-DNA--[protein]-cysteine S-methyltransferase [Thermotogota bacterium]
MIELNFLMQMPIGFFSVVFEKKNLYEISFVKANQTISARQQSFIGEEPADLLIIEDQIKQYIKGDRKEFNLNNYLKWFFNEDQPDEDSQHGTQFQKKVWQALLTIPYGTCCSYSEVAEQIGQPTAVRAVANVIGRNPLLMVIPCHRVIRKNGELGGFSAGLGLKKRLLKLERTYRSS